MRFGQPTAAAGGASAVSGLLTDQPAQAAPAPTGVPSRKVTLRINGRRRSVTVDNRTSLLDLLRENLRLTGPGTYTSMTQVAADALGLDMDRVEFRLGDSLMPPTPPHGGSQTIASVGSAVQHGCDKLRRQAIDLAVRDRQSPLYGADPATVIVRRGRVALRDQPARGETYRQLLTRQGRTHLEVRGSFAPPAGPERLPRTAKSTRSASRASARSSMSVSHRPSPTPSAPGLSRPR